MTSEEWQQQRILCIAQMAATLKAGMIANAWNAEHASAIKPVDAKTFAKLATRLFDAVDESEAAHV